jgi:uncharacterized membrane protein
MVGVAKRYELYETGRALDRVLAFSDGVFAIAITLLVLNFRVPELSGGDIDRKLLDFLDNEWSMLLNYVLSFFVIAKFWLAHHRLSLLLNKVDPAFMAWNLVLLAFIVFLPYPTELSGTYEDSVASTVIYSATLVVTSVVSAVLWRVAQEHKLMDERVTDDFNRHSNFRAMGIPIVFGLSIPIAFVNVSAARFSWLLLFAIRLFEARRFDSVHHPFGQPDDVQS